jgi:uncharacterized protein YndB with AHSA1/START domain
MRMPTALLLPLAAFAASPSCAAAQVPDPDRTIVKQVVVKAPLDAVWKAWTTSEGIVSFFAPEAKVEARPGGAFHVHFNPYAKPGLKGADDMTVLAVQEKEMISFTWNSPPHLAEVRPHRTSVQVRLKSLSPDETQVRLVHGGWGVGGQWDSSFKYFDGSWGRVLANLQKRFADGPIDWSPFLKQVKAFQDAEDAKAAK